MEPGTPEPTNETPGVPAAAPPFRSRPAVWATALFLALTVVYLLGAGPFPVGDALVNLYLPVRVLTRGELTFTPVESPFLFQWELEEPHRTKWKWTHQGQDPPVEPASWDDEILGRKAGDLLRDGVLKLSRPRYFLVPSAKEGRYVGIYGIGAGLAAVPYFAALSAVKGDWRANSRVLWAEARPFAAACIAGSAAFLFLALLAHLPRSSALALSLAYGLGTCVWCEPSQALWQQTPALLFASMGLYFRMRLTEGSRWAAACGLALGAAAFCRPTAGLLLVAVGVDVILRERKALWAFAAAAALPLLALATANACLLGSPFRFGQMAAAELLTESSGGAASSGSGPAALGLLFSPSRGLLVFSPFLAFAAWGAVRSWKSPAFAALRAPGLAAAAGYLIACSWFAWYGGWSFGYRILVEWAPVLVLLIIPVAEPIRARRPLLAAFVVATLWSAALQVLGVYGYDPAAWNGRAGVETDRGVVPASDSDPASLPRVSLNVDDPQYRGRLWSVVDSQIAYLLGRPGVFSERAASWEKHMERAAREKEGSP
jgi:hypothetical protein